MAKALRSSRLHMYERGRSTQGRKFLVYDNLGIYIRSTGAEARRYVVHIAFEVVNVHERRHCGARVMTSWTHGRRRGSQGAHDPPQMNLGEMRGDEVCNARERNWMKNLRDLTPQQFRT